MRSAAELSIFLGVTGFTYATKSDLMLAIRAATISGILVCLGGEVRMGRVHTSRTSSSR
jgi:hypothetical protein